MAFVVKDRVKETTTTQGTGTLTLDGAAVGFQSFTAIGDGNTTYYTITGGSQWEVGIGIYTASGTTLSRDTVLASSNNGNLVSFSAGSKDVFVVYPSGRAVIVNGTTIEVPNLATLPISAGGTGSNSATFSGANITSINANNISSGVLALAQGGTGSATASFSGANITSLNANNVSTGVLAVAQGGTGSATASFSGANITNINANAVSSGILGVLYGGTGSNSATFSGVNITSINASNISSGTLDNARTSASSSNGASTIVARDASGNFSAGTITATLSGNASTATSATSATSATTATTANGLATNATGNEIYNNGWFRNNNTGNGLYNQATTRGIWSAENYNSYGSYTTYGPGVNGWIGWAIQSSFHFMARNNVDCGLYDSSNGKWLIYGLYNSNGVGINTSSTSTSYGAYIGGALYATGNVVAYSDVRKKENIVTVADPISILMQLRGVYYNRIDDDKKKRQIGVIAQEVEKALPEVVTYADDVDEYGVAYGNFAGLFIEVLKEHQKEIASLKQEIEVLKGLKNGNNS